MDTWTPPRGGKITIGSSNRVLAKVRRIDYGDGYSQRSPMGLNSMAQTWSITINPVLLEEWEALDAFFRSQGGYKAFLWTPAGETQPRKFTCETWAVAWDRSRFGTFTATLQEVFDQ